MGFENPPKKSATFLGTPETLQIVTMGVVAVVVVVVVVVTAVGAIAAGVRCRHNGLCCPAEIVVVPTAIVVVFAILV